MNNKIIRKVLFCLSFVSATSLVTISTISCDNGKNYNVSIKSDCLELKENKTANSKSDYTCSFKIKDDVIETRYMDNIDLDKFKVKVSGNEIPVDAYSFIYQTNVKNTFTIQKQYITGDIEITADLSKRTQKQNCFFFEYDIEEYASFSTCEILYPKAERQGDIKDVDFTKTKSMDDIYLYDNVDIASIYGPLLGLEYNIFLVREDNKMIFRFNANEGKKLPKNIWLRSNARYTKKDEDFKITYNENYTSATMEIPFCFIRDNGSIRLNPDVEA